MNTEMLAKIIEKEFAFLQAKYGFGKFIIRDLGREVFFDFEREAETVSISFEVGSHPIIEIFVPSEKTNVKPTPWARKGEIARSRLFPKLNIKTKYDPQSMSSVETYVGELAIEFERAEHGWLNA
jgi:hypothetical protein